LSFHFLSAPQNKPKIKHCEAEKGSTWLITVESSFSFGSLVQTAGFYKIMTRSSKGLEYSKKKRKRNPAELPVKEYNLIVRTAKKEIRVKI
jgi:hypothetical protein